MAEATTTETAGTDQQEAVEQPVIKPQIPLGTFKLVTDGENFKASTDSISRYLLIGLLRDVIRKLETQPQAQLLAQTQTAPQAPAKAEEAAQEKDDEE